ncbi:MAG: TVP38/TMEM64 family protein [Proteobacteria bacterium]|nr:TVP38/TMEM64 family protein [Pseudomonadota bacterium]
MTLPIADWLIWLEAWAGQHPLLGAVAYILLTILATAAMLPGWISMMLGGLVFGLTMGLVYAMLGIVGGAAAAFLVGRTLARPWVERRIAGNAKLLALDDALEEQAFTIVVLTRIALVLPFNFLNYAYGITGVNIGVYVAGTAVGMLPIAGFYVYLGTLANDMSQILNEGANIGSNVWWAAAVALVAIVAVVLTVRRALNRALRRQLRESNTL